MPQKRKLILVTNDDGIKSPGIVAAVGAVRDLLAAHRDADGRVFLASATWVVTARNP